MDEIKTKHEIWELIHNIKKELKEHKSELFKDLDNVNNFTHPTYNENGLETDVSATPTEIMFDTFLQGYAEYIITSAVPEYISSTAKFTDLSDTPDTYQGNRRKFIRINDDETGLEFVEFNSDQFSQSTQLPSNITEESIANWNEAYSWGNHADAGYLTSGSVQSDWNEENVESLSYIKNKPNIPETSAYDIHIIDTSIHFEKTDISASDIQYSSEELSATNVGDAITGLQAELDNMISGSGTAGYVPVFVGGKELGYSSPEFEFDIPNSSNVKIGSTMIQASVGEPVSYLNLNDDSSSLGPTIGAWSADVNEVGYNVGISFGPGPGGGGGYSGWMKIHTSNFSQSEFNWLGYIKTGYGYYIGNSLVNVPAGGSTGHSLRKVSNDNYDVAWQSLTASDITDFETAVRGLFGAGTGLNYSDGQFAFDTAWGDSRYLTELGFNPNHMVQGQTDNRSINYDSEDMNEYTQSTFFRADGSAPNNPVGSGLGIHIQHPTNDLYSLQIFGRWGESLYWRGENNGVFDNWRTLWDSGNFNPTDYMPKSGGEFTGNVGLGVAEDSHTPLTIFRPSGQSSLKAGGGDGFLMLDSNGSQLRLNHYVNDNVAIASGGGNVSIGGTAPTTGFRLDVVGAIRVRGFLRADSDATIDDNLTVGGDANIDDDLTVGRDLTTNRHVIAGSRVYLNTDLFLQNGRSEPYSSTGFCHIYRQSEDLGVGSVRDGDMVFQSRTTESRGFAWYTGDTTPLLSMQLNSNGLRCHQDLQVDDDLTVGGSISANSGVDIEGLTPTTMLNLKRTDGVGANRVWRFFPSSYLADTDLDGFRIRIASADVLSMSEHGDLNVVRNLTVGGTLSASKSLELLGGVSDYGELSTGNAHIFRTDTQIGTVPFNAFGHLVLLPRTSADRNVYIVNGANRDIVARFNHVRNTRLYGDLHVDDNLTVGGVVNYLPSRQSFISDSASAQIYTSKDLPDGGYPWSQQGTLIIQPRTSTERDVIICTGSPTPAPTLGILGNGKIRAYGSATFDDDLTVGEKLTAGSAFVEGTLSIGSQSHVLSYDSTNNRIWFFEMGIQASDSSVFGELTATDLTAGGAVVTTGKRTYGVGGGSAPEERVSIDPANVKTIEVNPTSSEDQHYKLLDGVEGQDMYIYNDKSSSQQAVIHRDDPDQTTLVTIQYKEIALVRFWDGDWRVI